MLDSTKVVNRPFSILQNGQWLYVLASAHCRTVAMSTILQNGRTNQVVIFQSDFFTRMGAPVPQRAGGHIHHFSLYGFGFT